MIHKSPLPFISFIFLIFLSILPNFSLAQDDFPPGCEWSFEVFSEAETLVFDSATLKAGLPAYQTGGANSFTQSIKHLELKGLDVIPKELEVFENVETLKIFGLAKVPIQGIGYFPKLKHLIIRNGLLRITETSTWAKDLELFYGYRAKIYGIESFSQFPKLRWFELDKSGLFPFPNDIDTIEKLWYVQIINHRYGQIDLEKMDLREMKCLATFKVNSFKDIVKGKPLGHEGIEKVILDYPDAYK